MITNRLQGLVAAAILALAGATQAAIAAVGTLGDVSDRPMLDDLVRSSDIRLRTAARSAIKRLMNVRVAICP